MKRVVLLVGVLAGCQGVQAPGEIEVGCEDVSSVNDFSPTASGTLRNADLDDLWYVEDPGNVGTFRSGSTRLKRLLDGYLITDYGTERLSDTSTLWTSEVQNGDGTSNKFAHQLANYDKATDTLRNERIDCVAGARCKRCTGRLTRARWFNNEAESDHLTLVGQLGTGPTWDGDLSLNVRVSGTLAYLIRRDGLHIIETADPAHPVELGFYTRQTLGSRNDVKLVDAGAKRYALIADSPVDVVDVTDPAHPVLATQIPEIAHTVFTETRAGRTRAYFGGLTGTCPVYDVTDPAAPVFLGAYDAHASYVHDLSVVNDIAYLNAWEKGFLMVDFTTPAQPTLVGAWADTPLRASHSNWTTTAGGRHIALHGDEGNGARLDIVDIDPASPQFMTSIGSWQTHPGVSIHNLMAFGNKAYFTYYQDGVRVLDLSDPTKPTELGHYDTWDPRAPQASTALFVGAIGLDVDFARKLVFVADAPRGLIILSDQTP